MSHSPGDPAVDSNSDRTTLAYQLQEIDTKYDSRACPHNCDGTLSVDEKTRVLCETCRCTPQGVYIPPSEPIGMSEQRCSQYRWFYPKGQRCANGENHDRYRHSNHVRLPGGYEIVYDESHPAGIGDEYEYDVTTL